MEVGYIVIFWYGILHAFGPDHLTAIADFSIGKSLKKTSLITLMFAFGHGLMLFIFANLLHTYTIDQSLMAYGDVISSAVIIAMGLYLLFMAATDRIQLRHHIHDGREHIHIYFGKSHSHDGEVSSLSVWGMGALMGIGGVRGMLVTLGVLNGHQIQWSMVLVFVAGVSLVFVGFGVIILYINKHILTNILNIRRTFIFAGLISVLVGANIIFA